MIELLLLVILWFLNGYCFCLLVHRSGVLQRRRRKHRLQQKRSQLVRRKMKILEQLQLEDPMYAFRKLFSTKEVKT